MKTWIFALFVIPLFLCGQDLNFPGPDIRISRMYWESGDRLKVKYQYYFDPWSEQEIRHGKNSFWDKKGRLRREQIYEHGLLNGLFIQKRKNGSTKVLGTYIKGSKEGVWEYYDRSGRKTKALLFQNGQRLGAPTYFANSGEKKQNRFFKARKPDTPSSAQPASQK